MLIGLLLTLLTESFPTRQVWGESMGKLDKKGDTFSFLLNEQNRVRKIICCLKVKMHIFSYRFYISNNAQSCLKPPITDSVASFWKLSLPSGAELSAFCNAY